MKMTRTILKLTGAAYLLAVGSAFLVATTAPRFETQHGFSPALHQKVDAQENSDGNATAAGTIDNLTEET
jgi:hypothetical protein